MLRGLHYNNDSMHVPTSLWTGFFKQGWGVGDPHCAGGWKILLEGFNLYDGGNLSSEFEPSNLFQGQKQHSVNIEHWLRSKLAWLLYNEYEIKIRMVQVQWPQPKIKLLVGYNIIFLLVGATPPIRTSRENYQHVWSLINFKRARKS